MKLETISELKRLRAEATPGPWNVWQGNPWYIHSGPGPSAYDGLPVVGATQHDREQGKADIAYILALHQSLPELLAEIEQCFEMRAGSLASI